MALLIHCTSLSMVPACLVDNAAVVDLMGFIILDESELLTEKKKPRNESLFCVSSLALFSIPRTKLYHYTLISSPTHLSHSLQFPITALGCSPFSCFFLHCCRGYTMTTHILFMLATERRCQRLDSDILFILMNSFSPSRVLLKFSTLPHDGEMAQVTSRHFGVNRLKRQVRRDKSRTLHPPT